MTYQFFFKFQKYFPSANSFLLDFRRDHQIKSELYKISRTNPSSRSLLSIIRKLKWSVKRRRVHLPSVPDAFLGAVRAPDGPVQRHHVDSLALFTRTVPDKTMNASARSRDLLKTTVTRVHAADSRHDGTRCIIFIRTRRSRKTACRRRGGCA